MITLQQFQKNEIIIRENDLDEALYLIESGKVEVYTEIDGQKNVLAYLEKGDFFGEMALVDERPRSASVVAVDKTELKVYHRNEFLDILNNDQEIAVKFLSGIFSRLRDANTRLLNLQESEGLSSNITMENAPSEKTYELIIEGLTDKAINSLPDNPFHLIVNNIAFNIGRKSSDPFSDKHLEITDTKPLQISRNHLSIQVKNNKVALFDIGSSLGLSLNNERIGGSTRISGPLYLQAEHNNLVLGSEASEYKYNIKFL